MPDHYKVTQYDRKIYSFSTGTRTEEYCLKWIKKEFKHLKFYSVFKNGVLVDKKIVLTRK